MFERVGLLESLILPVNPARSFTSDYIYRKRTYVSAKIVPWSVVGPRPLLIQYLSLYNDHQKRRHEVRPGLSGLAQVSGRNAISWEDKFDLDIEYVDSVSFIGDWKIVFLTIYKVFIRHGVNTLSDDLMPIYKGSGNKEI